MWVEAVGSLQTVQFVILTARTGLPQHGQRPTCMVTGNLWPAGQTLYEHGSRRRLGGNRLSAVGLGGPSVIAVSGGV